MPSDASAYKQLRDAMLALHPSAFTSDAETERERPSTSYVGRFGDGCATGGFTLGAWRKHDLVGAITCERDPRRKVRHIGHVVGMMVHASAASRGLGRALLADCLDRLLANDQIHLVTLTVTADNQRAIKLYENAGFTRYGTLARAIRVDDRFYDKALMKLDLR